MASVHAHTARTRATARRLAPLVLTPLRACADGVVHGLSSGCSEVPLQDSHDQVDAHEYTVGGQRILLVTPKT